MIWVGGEVIVLLVIDGADFKEALGMVADGADFGGFFAGVDVAAVTAFPDGDFVGLEDDVFFNVFEEFGVAFFVGLFNFADLFKFFGNFSEAFFAGDFGEFFVHGGVFVIFAFYAEF